MFFEDLLPHLISRPVSLTSHVPTSILLLQQIEKDDVAVASNECWFISYLIKTRSLVQKLKGRHADSVVVS